MIGKAWILAPALAVGACADGNQSAGTEAESEMTVGSLANSDAVQNGIPPEQAEDRQALEGSPESRGVEDDGTQTTGDESGGRDTMTWHFSRTPAGPRLAYGEPQTDNVRLTLRCPAGGMGRSVVLSFIRPSETLENRPGQLTIASGGAERSLSVESRATELGGGHMFEAVAPLEAPPISRFRNGNDLKVRWSAETISVPAGGVDQETINQFFDACVP